MYALLQIPILFSPSSLLPSPPSSPSQPQPPSHIATSLSLRRSLLLSQIHSQSQTLPIQFSLKINNNNHHRQPTSYLQILAMPPTQIRL